MLFRSVKDEYALSLLELSNEHSEKELEQAIVSKIPIFLREFGGSCSFIGNQYRIEVNDKEYFIDILLYHRPLKCLIAIELKIGEFAPEYIGKMQFYLALMDDKVRLPDENPSIGIIMCKLKDKTIVEYALKESKKPIGVASYKIVSSTPQERSEEHTSELQSRQVISYAVFCLKKKRSRAMNSYPEAQRQ